MKIKLESQICVQPKADSSVNVCDMLCLVVVVVSAASWKASAASLCSRRNLALSVYLTQNIGSKYRKGDDAPAPPCNVDDSHE